MIMPFQKLVEALAARDIPPDMTIGELSKKYGETPGRVMDALTTIRMLRGEQTYIDALR